MMNTPKPTPDVLDPEDGLGDVIEEQEELRRERARLADKLTRLFHTLDRMITLLRVYPTGHPLVANFGEQTARQIQEIVDAHDQILVRIKATELLTEWGETFFTREDSEREQFLWYKPAADGIIRFELRDGLGGEELITFMDVINRAALGRLPLDDDTVTLLWEANLEHIDYRAIEGYIDTGEVGVFGGLSEPDAKATVMGAAIDPKGASGQKLDEIFAEEEELEPDLFTRLQYKTQSLEQMTRVPDDMLADAFRVDTTWRHELVTEWTEGNDLEYRFIESLLSVIRTSPGSEQSDRAAESIFEICTQLLDENAYESVTLIVRLLRARAEVFEGLGEEDRNPLEEIIEYLSDPLRIESLIFQAQKKPERRRPIVRLLQLLDADTVQHHILQTLAAPNKEVHVLSTLVGVLLAVSTEENERNLLAPKHLSNETYLERVLKGTRGRDINAHPMLPRLLSKAMEHESPHIKRLALAQTDPSWCSPMIIESYIQPLMSSQDHEIRKLAIDAVRHHAPEKFERWIERVIDPDELRFRAPGELRFLLRRYLELSSPDLERLYPMLKTRGWFREDRRQLARIVAQVLLEREDDQAVALIREYAESLWTARALRETYRELLEHYGQAEDPAQPTSTPEGDDE